MANQRSTGYDHLVNLDAVVDQLTDDKASVINKDVTIEYCKSEFC